MRPTLANNAIIELLKTAQIRLGETAGPDRLALLVQPEFLTEVCEMCKLSLSDFLGKRESRYPHISVEATPALREYLEECGVYGAEDRNNFGGRRGIGYTYSLELLSKGNLRVKYVAILGSWHLGTISDSEVADLKQTCADALVSATQSA